MRKVIIFVLIALMLTGCGEEKIHIDGGLTANGDLDVQYSKQGYTYTFTSKGIKFDSVYVMPINNIQNVSMLYGDELDILGCYVSRGEFHPTAKIMLDESYRDVATSKDSVVIQIAENCYLNIYSTSEYWNEEVCTKVHVKIEQDTEKYPLVDCSLQDVIDAIRIADLDLYVEEED